MAANTNPIFTLTSVSKPVSMTATANTSRTVFATGTDLYTAGTNGSLIERIKFEATATTTAGVLRVWIYDSSSYFMIDEILVTAIVPSSTVASFTSVWTPPGGYLLLPNTYKISATTHNAEAFNALVMGGEF